MTQGVSLMPSGERAIHVKLMGEFAISDSGADCVRWRASKARSLFGVLLVNRNSVVGKERLRELLWPGIDGPSTSLKVTVHALRRTLDTHFGPERRDLHIEFRDFGYIMDVSDDVIVDCQEFERYTAAAREAVARGLREEALGLYRRAAALYSGEFLDGESDSWVIEHRHWLRSMILSALNTLAEYALEAGELADAADACRRTLAIDTANEAAFRRLMTIHARRGELQQAEQWYALCAQRLREQFEIDPNQDTRSLRHRLLGSEFLEGARPVRAGRRARDGVSNRMGSIV
ncbi:AfsR/SARP family transcriptional regulator [Nocardia sp. CA-151230]|uniref:AfsR/SARP family transcriptional regulator n=1 Tax=Nocardia sp. CA-151230 TaxID=3239982 RepID=UPI003D8E79B3